MLVLILHQLGLHCLSISCSQRSDRFLLCPCSTKRAVWLRDLWVS